MDMGLRNLMSRTKEGRDALRSPEAHPQARSIASAWAERSQRRVPISRHRPKSAETGETHPLPGAGLRPVRRRGAVLLRWQPLITNIVLALRQGSSTKSTYCGRSRLQASTPQMARRRSFAGRSRFKLQGAKSNRRRLGAPKGDSGLFDIIIVERLAEGCRIRDFAIALLEALIPRIKTKAVFPRFGLNDVGSNTA